MKHYAEEFGPFEGRVWLNTAHQGALPKVAAEAAREAIRWKTTPWELTTERFQKIPQELRAALGRLVNVSGDEVVLANSSSFGLHLLANGIPWNQGDEVLVVRGDFPSTILPWMGLQERGVFVREIEPEGDVVGVEDLERSQTSRTRLFCTTWVHSFTGHVVDEQALGRWCRDRGITFVLNASQGIGARPLDIARTPVDAISSVGFKWLCGPYGTGFCWIRPTLRETLQYNQLYWLAMQTADDLEKQQSLSIDKTLGARQYDVFGTANFFNYTAWQASIECILDKSVQAIEDHNQQLVDRFTRGLPDAKYALLSPTDRRHRASLVFIRPRQPDQTREVYDKLRQANIYIALRRGKMRISPHLYNTKSDIDQLLDQLDAAIPG